MSGNLADPEFEPSDEQLAELSRAAFADVRRRHEESLLALRKKIAEAIRNSEKSEGG